MSLKWYNNYYNIIILFFHYNRRDFRLLVGIPDPNHPIPQPVFWFNEDLPPQVSLHKISLCNSSVKCMSFPSLLKYFPLCQPDGTYVAKVSIPEEGGWRAFMIQVSERKALSLFEKEQEGEYA